ncbi:DoxX family protein [Nocardia niwae]|uniref:DoxX family protein n=1 Tax=Nocardia niwae TaxID=626084 RepID=A0ABV2X9I0_9NOCA|nr:DoxX family protein [Nocardia niwae]
MLAVLLAVGFAPLGVAKVMAVQEMRKRAEHTGFSVSGYRGIGALELAGAVGLLVGIAWWPLGAAAGLGLASMMVGALVTHLRIGDGPREFAPSILIGSIAIAYVATVFGAH